MSVGGGTSRADTLLEERRRVLRTALKGEYIRCVFIGHFVELNHNRYLLRKKNHLKTIQCILWQIMTLRPLNWFTGKSTTPRHTLPREASSLMLLCRGRIFHSPFRGAIFVRCRWHALQFTYGDHFKPTFTNFIKYSLTGAIPVFLYYQWCWGPHHKVDCSAEITWNLTPFLLLQEYSRAVRRGEVAYDADSRKMKYFN